MNLERRAAMLAGKSAGGLDVISGTAVCSGTTLTMPIPAGHFFYASLAKPAEGHMLDGGHLRQIYRDGYGFFRLKQGYGGAERQTGNPFDNIYYVTQSAEQIVLNCSNGNTSGLLVDGDEWTFVAWKEA